jgi:membrane-bound lytic murein transglycosylase D
MKISVRCRFSALISLFLLLLLGGCSSNEERQVSTETFPKGRQTSTGTFPVPPEIQDNVAFWRNVYSKWSRGKVAIHDDEYMGVIYEVATLPGAIHTSYTPEQKRFVRAREAHFKSRLEGLEAKVRSGRSPSGYEKGLYAKLIDAGGKRAIYGASDRVRSQRGLRERFHRGLEISGRYDAKFRKIFRSKGLPEDLAYLPHVESSFQAHAKSSVGAAGMWQFTRGTGKIYMTVNSTIDERLDPVIAAEGAARYLGDAHRKLHSWPLAVTSYNHGQGGMKTAKATHGNNIGTIVRNYKGRYFGFASRNFYAEFIAAREIARNPKKYFPEGVHYQPPLAEDRLVLPHSMPAPQVARHYGVSTYRLADLNRHWRGPARNGRANLPRGSTVWLPQGTTGGVAGTRLPMPVTVAKKEPKPVKVAKVQPRPKPVKVAKAQPTYETAKAAKTKSKPKQTKTAKAEPKPKPVKGRKAASARTAKVHVVKANETLYRVSTRYEISVDELRRLNRMGPKDTNIRPGQRLRVSS